MYVYRPSNCCLFLYWGHCECLAIVGPVRVLSAVIVFMKLFYEQMR